MYVYNFKMHGNVCKVKLAPLQRAHLGLENSIPDLLSECVLEHSFGRAFQHHQSMLKKKSLLGQKYHKYV